MADDVDALLADLYALTGEDIGLQIGVLEGTTTVARDGSTMQVAEYAAYNEFGTENIEPRPAVRRTHDLREEEWSEYLGNLIAGGEEPEQALDSVGQQAAADIQEAIEEWKEPPNKPSTIKRKRSGRDNPLVDKGAYSDSISYQIVRGSHDGGA